MNDCGTADDLLVSDFAGAEVASAMSPLVRGNLPDATDATTRLAAFDTRRASMAAAGARLADIVVRRFDLTLVTLDRRLARAADFLGLRVRIPGT